MKNRMILLTLLVFITILVGFSQTQTKQTSDNLTPDKLKQKYGSPNEKGQYKVRTGIGLIAKFKENEQPLEVLIEPLSQSKERPSEQEPSKVMLSDMAEEVFNELVPDAKRGKKRDTTTIVSGCTSIDSTEYERVRINTVKRCEQQGEGTYSIRVCWK